MKKIIVTPDAAGVVSDMQGRIVGQVLAPDAVVVEFAGDSLDLDVYQAAIVHEGELAVVSDYRGTGPWYDQRAALADRLTQHQVLALGITPPNAEGRPVTIGWEHMAMTPRALTKAEIAAQAKAEADALAKAEADALANMEITAVQARLAANDMGIRDDIEAVMANPTTPRDVRDLWEYAPVFVRSHPLWAQFAPLINKTSTDIDAFFQLAKTK